MAIFADWRRSQTIDTAGIDLAKYALKVNSRCMMAFIDYHHTIFTNKRLYLIVANA